MFISRDCAESQSATSYQVVLGFEKRTVLFKSGTIRLYNRDMSEREDEKMIQRPLLDMEAGLVLVLAGVNKVVGIETHRHLGDISHDTIPG